MDAPRWTRFSTSRKTSEGANLSPLSPPFPLSLWAVGWGGTFVPSSMRSTFFLIVSGLTLASLSPEAQAVAVEEGLRQTEVQALAHGLERLFHLIQAGSVAKVKQAVHLRGMCVKPPR